MLVSARNKILNSFSHDLKNVAWIDLMNSWNYFQEPEILNTNISYDIAKYTYYAGIKLHNKLSLLLRYVSRNVRYLSQIFLSDTF
jgi:hypothetical protein